LPEIISWNGETNNKLCIDYRLVTRIERKASKTSQPGHRRSVSFIEPLRTASPVLTEAESGRTDSNSSFGDLSEESFTLTQRQPRRAVSTAERLDRAGESPRDKRTTNARAKSSLQLRTTQLCDMVSTEAAGTLYGSDVVLLLELPDLKRCSDLNLVAGAFNKPKDGTGEGEDSYYVAEPTLGVADGVGGLQSVLGHTSKGFADSLMAGCRNSAQALPERIGPAEKAEHLLKEGYGQVKAVHGAATAVVTYFDSRTRTLGVANLGDSGVMVVRRPTKRQGQDSNSSMYSTRSYIVFKSPAQQHDFNYPYQLCNLPKGLSKKLLRSPDSPSDCMTFDVEVEEGDLILVYSDGVDDNLHDQEILEICDRALSPYAAHVLGLSAEAATQPDMVAKAIGSAAYVRSGNEKARTPFAEEARKAGWPLAWCVGGKEDDITCLAAWVAHGTFKQDDKDAKTQKAS